MKKIYLFILVLLFCISTDSYSQKKVKFGFILGYCPSWISGDQFHVDELNAALEASGINLDFPMKKELRSFQFNLGGFIVYNFLPFAGLKLGIEYIPKGVEYNGEIDLTNTSWYEFYQTMKLSYFEFPISLQFSTGSKEKPDKTLFYVDLGVSPALKVISKSDVGVSLVEFDLNTLTKKYLDGQSETNALEGINSFDLGAFCSLGVDWGNFLIDLKYERGLINIIENPVNNVDLRNNMVALNFKFKF